MQVLETEMSAGRRYTIALCKGAALVDETRTLVQHWTVNGHVKVHKSGRMS